MKMDKRLELLFDYTKFHIGIYLTLTGAFIALGTAKSSDRLLFDLNSTLVVIAVLCFILAGWAGGVILSSITQTTCTTIGDFLEEKLGPWEFQWCPAKYWARAEHALFWFGLTIVVLSLLLSVFV